MTFRERIDFILQEYNLTRAEFERRCGLSNGYTRNLGGIPGADKIEKILTNFPQISREWLINGDGPMLCPNINQENVSGTNVVGENTVNNNLSNELIDIIKKKDEQIDRLITIIENLNK